jgi:hypothetical protein
MLAAEAERWEGDTLIYQSGCAMRLRNTTAQEHAMGMRKSHTSASRRGRPCEMWSGQLRPSHDADGRRRTRIGARRLSPNTPPRPRRA